MLRCSQSSGAAMITFVTSPPAESPPPAFTNTMRKAFYPSKALIYTSVFALMVIMITRWKFRVTSGLSTSAKHYEESVDANWIFICRPREPSINQLAFRELTEKHGEALTTFRSMIWIILILIFRSKPSSLVNITLKNR